MSRSSDPTIRTLLTLFHLLTSMFTYFTMSNLFEVNILSEDTRIQVWRGKLMKMVWSLSCIHIAALRHGWRGSLIPAPASLSEIMAEAVLQTGEPLMRVTAHL